MSLFDSDKGLAESLGLPEEKTYNARLISSIEFITKNTYERSATYGHLVNRIKFLFQVYDKQGNSFMVESKEMGSSLTATESGLSKFFAAILPSDMTLSQLIKTEFDGKMSNLVYTNNSEGRCLQVRAKVKIRVSKSKTPTGAFIEGYDIYDASEYGEMPPVDESKFYDLVESLKLKRIEPTRDGIVWFREEYKKKEESKDSEKDKKELDNDEPF